MKLAWKLVIIIVNKTFWQGSPFLVSKTCLMTAWSHVLLLINAAFGDELPNALPRVTIPVASHTRVARRVAHWVAYRVASCKRALMVSLINFVLIGQFIRQRVLMTGACVAHRFWSRCFIYCERFTSNWFDNHNAYGSWITTFSLSATLIYWKDCAEKWIFYPVIFI